jgi:hypothetical protein
MFASFVICFGLQAQAVPQKNAPRKIVCKGPMNAPSCYWTHGRLSFYSGAPAYRVWKVGTKRLLGIYSGASAWRGDRLAPDNEDPEFPASVEKAWDSRIGTALFADFEICPLEPERLGFMQASCIESAKNIFVERYSSK